MTIAAPPLYGPSMQFGGVGSAIDGDVGPADGRGDDLVYPGYYYGSPRSPSLGNDHNDRHEPSFGQYYRHLAGAMSPYHHQWHQQQNQVGSEYYSYSHYRAEPVMGLLKQQKLGPAGPRGYLLKPEQCVQPAKDQYQYATQASHSYYTQSSAEQVCTSFYDEEGNVEEESEPVLGTTLASAATSTIRDRILPSIFSLAKKLLPAALRRSEGGQQEKSLDDTPVYEDGFVGTCSPFGSPDSSPRPASHSSSFSSPPPYYRMESEQSSDCYDYTDGRYESATGASLECTKYTDSYIEAGGETSEQTVQYMPHSTALLVTALQKNAIKKKMDERIDHQRSHQKPSVVASDISDVSAQEFFDSPINSPALSKKLFDDECRSGVASAAAAIAQGSICVSPIVQRSDTSESDASYFFNSPIPSEPGAPQSKERVADKMFSSQEPRNDGLNNDGSDETEECDDVGPLGSCVIL